MLNKYLLIFVCILVGGIVSPSKAHATHGAGGELIYEWVSDSTYRFYFRYFRDCSGASEESTQRMCYFNVCGSVSGSITLTKMNVLPDGRANGLEVDPGCPGYPTRCMGGTSGLPGYREWWYTGVYTLPSRCDYWTFSVVISNRNTSTNIGTGDLYIEATLNNRNGLRNRSPYFSMRPVPYVCVGMPYSFNNGAIDPDGDSLSFEFIQPRTAGACQAVYSATPVAYRSPTFNLNEPFSTGNTFNFNTANGEMTFTPAALSTNTVSVRVSDWRNGVRIGSVMRDIQIQVLACSSPPTSVTPDPVSVTGGHIIGGQVQGAANQPLSFCFNVASDSANRRLVVSDNHTVSIPGSNILYLNQGANRVTGCFTWTPGCADTGMRTLTIVVKDSTCLPPGVAVTRVFTIPVYIRTGSSTEREVIICRDAEVQLQTTGGIQARWSVQPGGSPIGSLSCTTCSSPVARPEVTTVYEAFSGSESCYNTDRITVRVDNDNNQIAITMLPEVLCSSGYVDLSVSASGPRPLSNIACGPTASAPSAVMDTVEIIPWNAPIQNMNNPVSTPFSGNHSVTARHQYLLRAADIRASGMYSGTLYGMSFRISSIGTGAVYDNLTISLGCTREQEMSTAGGFFSGTSQVYASAGTVNIPPGGGYLQFDFIVPYNWDTMQNLIVDVCYANSVPVSPVYTYFFNNSYQSTLYSYDTSGSICSGGASTGTVYSTHELPQMRFNYQPAPESDFSWRWGNSLFEPSSIGSSVRTYVDESKKIWVHANSRHGCLIGDTLDLHIPPSFRVLPENAAICLGDTLSLYAEHSTDSRWYENGFNPANTLSCIHCDTPRAFPVAGVVYTAVLRNDLGCADTLYVPVEVKPVPDVRIIRPVADTTVRYQERLQLIAEGAEHYVWSPPRYLDNAYINNPVSMAENATTYIVTGMSDGCIGYDTVRVHVDFRGHVMIPSAFSPNGDGKNDLFRVANLSFQQIMEFRVFNRWGEEVFYAAPGDKAEWDGTLQGQPQPIDTYRYLIRIAYPDGQMETYNGDVTLVR